MNLFGNAQSSRCGDERHIVCRGVDKYSMNYFTNKLYCITICTYGIAFPGISLVIDIAKFQALKAVQVPFTPFIGNYGNAISKVTSINTMRMPIADAGGTIQLPYPVPRYIRSISA
jgi:hypothetical protein